MLNLARYSFTITHKPLNVKVRKMYTTLVVLAVIGFACVLFLAATVPLWYK
jgi:hypothetical protein